MYGYIVISTGDSLTELMAFYSCEGGKKKEKMTKPLSFVMYFLLEHGNYDML